MPELPEVTTIVRQLNQKVLKRTFIDVWTDSPGIIKKPENFLEFKKNIKGRQIEKIWRAGKNIIFNLSGGFFLLIHQKLTGHLLYGVWLRGNKDWLAEGSKELKERVNKYIHLIFFLDNGKMIALSDLRKFAKAELIKSKELKAELEILGPDPLKINFAEFKKRLLLKKGKIKQVLMDQNVIAGIGNIYSDEALFLAKIHPCQKISQLNGRELKKIYIAINQVLNKGIKVRGESFSDFRDLFGKKGGFDAFRKVYRREGEKCFRCGVIIKKVKVGGRTAHYCPNCQRINSGAEKSGAGNK